VLVVLHSEGILFFDSGQKIGRKTKSPQAPFAKGGEEILACSNGYKSAYFCRAERKIDASKMAKV